MCCNDPPRQRAQAGRAHRGFSLVEIMIVLVIIGIMAGTVTVATKHYLDRARVTRARQDIGQIVNALNAFYTEKSRYPTNDEGLVVLAPTYVDRVSQDPWGRPYQYNALGADGFEVISFGRDGRQGGSGADADITSADAGGDGSGADA